MRFSALICLCADLAIAFAAVWFVSLKEGASFGGGLLAGSLSALLSLHLIWNQALKYSTKDPQQTRRQAAGGYALRYLIYALILGAAAFVGASPLGMLAGVLVQKASLYAWAYINRKEKT